MERKNASPEKRRLLHGESSHQPISSRRRRVCSHLVKFVVVGFDGRGPSIKLSLGTHLRHTWLRAEGQSQQLLTGTGLAEARVLFIFHVCVRTYTDFGVQCRTVHKKHLFRARLVVYLDRTA